ncbi:helix-turn-helix domain-containing protein [Chitinophaga alhagiae]|uniref:helix-turn-helix domain-containing protein n=1 Tax=Chitinophaga alhagiae TaxID=2203219 RepID=UPI000E5BB2D3|nr:AraC family transcriptional regulator [Chitinophaga alhagiae]
MEADIATLYTSGFYRVLDFKCRCTQCATSKPEYADAFCISFVRKGNFLFNVFRNSFDAHTGRVLITKPGYEHTVTHTHQVPDECTIVEFPAEFYRQTRVHYGNNRFFTDNDLHSLQTGTSPATEYLHHRLLHLLLSGRAERLQTDTLVLEIVERTLGALMPEGPDPLGRRLKRNHLGTVEQAKAYILEHFPDDISLTDIAAACCVSPFHFSRIFKTFTGCSPHSFLLSVRLKNAELLLKTTASPVADIAFASGFNSPDHFSAAFAAHAGHSPARYRQLTA